MKRSICTMSVPTGVARLLFWWLMSVNKLCTPSVDFYGTLGHFCYCCIN